MAIDDLDLHRPDAPPPAPPVRSRESASALRWVVVACAGVIAGGLLTYWWMSRSQLTTATPAPTTATDVAVGSSRPKRQAIDLPSLDGSDTLLRELIATLSRHPTLARFLATPGLVRGTTLAVVQIGDGRTPSVPLQALRPSTRVQIVGGAATGRVDPASYARWDASVTALTSVSPADAAQLYVNVKPLFDQAYIELGHPGGDFDSAIVRAVQVLRETPTLTDDPALLRRTNYFEHDDLALRALSPVQKQFLLAGPENRGRVLSWLRQFATTLDLKVN